MDIEIQVVPMPSEELLGTLQFMKDLNERMMAQLAIPAEFFKEEPIDYARELRRFELAVYRLIGATPSPTRPFIIR